MCDSSAPSFFNFKTGLSIRSAEAFSWTDTRQAWLDIQAQGMNKTIPVPPDNSSYFLHYFPFIYYFLKCLSVSAERFSSLLPQYNRAVILKKLSFLRDVHPLVVIHIANLLSSHSFTVSTVWLYNTGIKEFEQFFWTL